MPALTAKAHKNSGTNLKIRDFPVTNIFWSAFIYAPNFDVLQYTSIQFNETKISIETKISSVWQFTYFIMKVCAKNYSSKLEVSTQNLCWANMKIDPFLALKGPIFRATRMSTCSQIGIGRNNSQPKCHTHNH